MLWMSPSTVLNIALVITVRLGARRQEAFGSSLVDPRAVDQRWPVATHTATMLRNLRRQERLLRRSMLS